MRVPLFSCQRRTSQLFSNKVQLNSFHPSKRVSFCNAGASSNVLGIFWALIKAASRTLCLIQSQMQPTRICQGWPTGHSVQKWHCMEERRRNASPFPPSFLLQSFTNPLQLNDLLFCWVGSCKGRQFLRAVQGFNGKNNSLSWAQRQIGKKWSWHRTGYKCVCFSMPLRLVLKHFSIRTHL